MQEDLKMAIAVRLALLPEIFRRIARHTASLLEEFPQMAESESAEHLVTLVVRGDKFCNDVRDYYFDLGIFDPSFEQKVIANLERILDEVLLEKDPVEALKQTTPEGLVS